MVAVKWIVQTVKGRDIVLMVDNVSTVMEKEQLLVTVVVEAELLENNKQEEEKYEMP